MLHPTLPKLHTWTFLLIVHMDNGVPLLTPWLPQPVQTTFVYFESIFAVTPTSLFYLSSATVWHISSLVWSDFLLTPLFWTFLEPSKPCRSELSAFTLSACRSPHQCYRVISNHVAKILPVSSGIMLCSCSSTSSSLRCNILVGVPSSPFPLWLSFSSPSLTPVRVQGDE